MRNHLRVLALVTMTLTTMVGVAGAQDFHWSGSLARGKTIEIRGVNGNIVADPARGATVDVTAEKIGRRDDPATVKIQVVPSSAGVTICAVYPDRDGSKPNECEPGQDHMNVRDTDVRVNFTVRVPAGVLFDGHTLNGDIDAERLDSDINLHTVNGSLSFSTTGQAQASTVNGSIRGEIGRADWTDTLTLKTVNGGITLTLPADIHTEVQASTVNGDISTDFPLTVSGRISRRRLDGTIGGGGRVLSLRTVNGPITLKRG